MTTRLSLAHSYDLKLRLGVVVVAVERGPIWERILRGVNAGVLRAAALELALEVARELRLDGIELRACDELPELPQAVIGEFAGVERCRVKPRQNAVARRHAHRRLRELAPVPEEVYGLAEWGADLEIERFMAEDPGDAVAAKATARST